MEEWKRYSIQIMKAGPYACPNWIIHSTYSDIDEAIAIIKTIPMDKTIIWKRIGIDNGIGFEKNYIHFIE